MLQTANDQTLINPAVRNAAQTGTPSANTAGTGSAPSATSSAAATTGADFENFLQLLTAQLRNQDPLSPIESSQFVAQLASFSTVEQLVNVNDQLDGIARGLNGDSLDRFASLLGQNAELTDTPAYFDGERLPFRLASVPEATRVEVLVMGPRGETIGQFEAANSSALQELRPQTIPPGTYTLTASYYQGDELIRLETPSTIGRIEEVRIGADGAVNLRLNGDRQAPASNVAALLAI